MEFYRAYVQPNRPENFRVFGFDVVDDDKVPYSNALRTACKQWAGPKPPLPSYCPRCGLENAPLTSNLCYKVGIAGAWNFLCFSCHKVHVPAQQGPTNEGLEHIESVRAHDHEVFMERKANKAKKRAKTRAKARAKAQQENTGDEATSRVSNVPFGMLNNAAKLLDLGTSSAGGGHGLKVEKTEYATIARLPAINYYMKGSRSHAGHLDGAEDKLRTVELVFWERDREPRVGRVPVQFEHELLLYKFPYFQSMRGPCAFKRFSFEGSIWCDLPWSISPIHLGPEDDVILVRAMGVRCHGFGRQLERYQRRHGLALNPGWGIRATINIPPPRHQWLVIWGKHARTPEMHLFNLDLTNGLDDEARLALPWAHLISDAAFLLIWHETESAWAAVRRGVSSGVIEAPIMLVAHPLAEFLVGSGEAIAWLEEWRLGGGPRSRATTPDGSKHGNAMRALSPPVSDEQVRLTVTSMTKPKTNVLIAQPSGNSTASRTSISQPSMARDGRRSVSPASWHARCSLDNKPHALLVSSPPPRHGDESCSVADRGRACVIKRPASVSSDEDVVLLEGPSSAPLVSDARDKIRISVSSANDDVEVMEAPPSVKRSHQSRKKRRVLAPSDTRMLVPPSAPSKKLPIPSVPPTFSDDDIVLIDNPSAALTRRFSKKAHASASSVQSVSATSHRAQTTSPHGRTEEGSSDEVEFVEDSSVVPKRRLSNWNGQEIIDLT